VDRRSLELEDEDIVKRVWTANSNTVLVLISSFPYAINWSEDKVPAIVHSTHNSQELGNALADVLFGDYNPAGRLVQTWPRAIEQLPPMMDYDIRHGRTYMYFTGEPLYPFGFGLSYTTFVYSNLRSSQGSSSGVALLTVSVDVTNTGVRAGEEVVQLYVARPRSALTRPRRQLASFCRVGLEAGETKIVTLEIRASELQHWDSAQRRFVIEPGAVELLVGASSADIRLRETITLAGS
jgi:beta-glucosidase